MIQNEIKEWMTSEGFYLHEIIEPAHIYINNDEHRCIIVDIDICNTKTMSYNEYTQLQNRLMHQHDKLYRFAIDNSEDLRDAKNLYNLLLNNEVGKETGKTLNKYGPDRSEESIDPTRIEYYFEEAFIDLYGRDFMDRVIREASFPDVYGNERFYDYLIQVQLTHNNLGSVTYWIAIEQNGEKYHHPAIIGKKKYKSQIIKQNSFISYGNKLYRWSLSGMIDKNNFIQDLRRYLGEGKDFLTTSFIKASRQITLFNHQETVLKDIDQSRKKGRNTFMIVLPTGTGKTHILFEDLSNQYSNNPNLKTLILVPSKAIQNQIKEKLQHSPTISKNYHSKFLISTYLWMAVHYRDYSCDYFDYIAVDEAHHAVAPSLKRVIQYFTPKNLIGMTATDERLDEQNLEDIFGTYETKLSLKEAILKGILAPIHAFRISSNLDLSEIRFNGKDYVQSDLQRHIIIESRDQLIVDVLKKYFANDRMKKQGLIFCVNIRHAESLAKRMNSNGIPTKAVSGKEKLSQQYLEDYKRKNLQFLTTCSLIHEGWDSPQTAVIVMARPTMSKVLYTQQIGRGTRRHPEKEALYIIDVIDNYGPMKNPWNLHALTNIAYYKPWANIFEMECSEKKLGDEEIILSGFYEKERKIEKINIFTFEKEYGNYYSLEQFARELFVSTGTVRNWIKNGSITPAISLPFGRSKLSYFAPSQLEEVRTQKKLKVHNEFTIYEDFNDFLEEKDYTFSYKIVFLLALFALMDNEGTCKLDVLTKLYGAFYKNRIRQNKPVDRKGCPYTDEFLANTDLVQRSILMNPFEKFERKRFMFHVKPNKKDVKAHPEYRDLNYISFSSILWEKINNPTDKEKIKEMMKKDLSDYYQQLGGLTNFSFTARYHVDSSIASGLFAAENVNGEYGNKN